eukprot:1938634-Alexandrium_andersonii.AAC.1
MPEAQVGGGHARVLNLATNDTWRRRVDGDISGGPNLAQGMELSNSRESAARTFDLEGST